MVHAPSRGSVCRLTPQRYGRCWQGPFSVALSRFVSVWIATSRACNVSLLLFDGADIVASRNEQDDLRAKWVSAPQPTVQIGAHLHVLTVVLVRLHARRQCGAIRRRDTRSQPYVFL